MSTWSKDHYDQAIVIVIMAKSPMNIIRMLLMKAEELDVVP